MWLLVRLMMFVLALGEATKTIPFITDALKCYRFLAVLGAATDTNGASGRVIATASVRPSDAQIEAALGAFRGR